MPWSCWEWMNIHVRGVHGVEGVWQRRRQGAHVIGGCLLSNWTNQQATSSEHNHSHRYWELAKLTSRSQTGKTQGARVTHVVQLAWQLL